MKGGFVTVPTEFVLIKNSTLEIEPSASDAVVLNLKNCGDPKTTPWVGQRIEMEGGRLAATASQPRPASKFAVAKAIAALRYAERKVLIRVRKV